MLPITRPTIPAFWKNVLAVIALGKAAIAGAGLGIAALGIVDVATAASIREHVALLTHDHTLEAFSATGGCIAVVWRLFTSVLR